MNATIKWIAAIVGGGIVLAGLIVWVVFYKTPTVTPDVSQPQFGSGTTNATVDTTPLSSTNEAQIIEGTVSAEKVFKISSGPIAGAVLMTTTRPTSTIARFVMANSGHVFDFSIDTPGAVPKAISNTTIPGVIRAPWSEGGRGALLQYLDGEIVKTAHLSLPAPAATSSPIRIQFLTAGAKSLSVSPDGANVAYLLPTATGVDGYTARADGTNPKKIFSLPLTQLLLSWPAANTLLAYTPAASGVPGAAFSVNVTSGAVTPILYADGLTAAADRTFSKILYQTVSQTKDTYLQSTATGLSIPLAFDPLPELCKFSLAATSTVYCATPLSVAGAEYLNLWYLGAANQAHAILSYNTNNGATTKVASPGGRSGGEEAVIAELILSPTDDYLLYIRKSDRSLWGVRLKD